MSPMNVFVLWFFIFFVNKIPCKGHGGIQQADQSYNMYEVVAFNSRERSLLYSVARHFEHMYFLNGVTNEAGLPIYVAVASCSIGHFEYIMIRNGIQFSLLPEQSSRSGEKRSELMFRSWANFTKCINTAQKKNPDILSKTLIGKTSQLRRLIVLRVSQARKNMAVFIIGGEDARDWASAEIVLQLMDIVLHYGSPLNKLLEYYDFYFLPLLNPDGYEYSRSMNRFWSKNRKPIFLQPQSNCQEDEKITGVNIDRNWYNPNPEKFGDENDCEALTIGKESLSEEETKSLANYLSSIAPALMFFMNVRGFSNIITMPYGYMRDHPENYPLMLEILKSAHKSVYEQYNVTYDYGNAARLMFNVTGNCADWVKKELNVPLVYTIYMMHEDHVMPLNSHTKVLTAHLALLLEEMLTTSQKIYGPLFNSCKANKEVTFIIFAVTFTLLSFV